MQIALSNLVLTTPVLSEQVIGQVVDDKVVYARSETKEDGRLYYQFELNGPHVRTSMTHRSGRGD